MEENTTEQIMGEDMRSKSDEIFKVTIQYREASQEAV